MTVAKSSAFIVLGMHRSGTSALGGVLQRLGVDLGDNLMPAMKGVNEKGFYEHQGIVSLHEKILKVLGFSWLDVRPTPRDWWKFLEVSPFKEELKNLIRNDFGSAVTWGVKDPRICRLLPLWLEIISELGIEPLFVLNFRHPDEVVESLHKRDGLELDGGYCLWLWHVLEAEHLSRGHKRSFVFFSNIIKNWRREIDRVASELDIEWPANADDSSSEIDSFIDGGLRHCDTHNAVQDSVFKSLAHRLYNILDEEKFDECEKIREQFLKEIGKSEISLEFINRIQTLHESSTHVMRQLEAEKKNSVEQIEYRDALVKELSEQLEAEKKNAVEQIEYRDALVKELSENVMLFHAETASLKAQIPSRKGIRKLPVHPLKKGEV